MSERARRLFAEANALPRDERVWLAEQILSITDGGADSGKFDDDAEIAAAWEAELARRAEELRTGKVKGIPAAEARRMIFDDRPPLPD